ncbi:MAG: lipoyl synthase [Anaerolineae bacterium]|nr:lipoyl synthase [Anaerolineae bacterium]
MSEISDEMTDTQRGYLRKPRWLRARLPAGEVSAQVARLMRHEHLHTVCEEAHCPNLGECWGRRTATFLIMGDTCTRNCRFCNVLTGRPAPLDPAEPQRVAEAATALGLRHVVITSVDRDDLPDGGAAHFAETIRQVRRALPDCTIEPLIPDFRGDAGLLAQVMDAHPDILNHNVEMVRRLYPQVRPQGKYEWALATLRQAKGCDPGVLTKSGIMLGLGETDAEVEATLRDLRAVGVDILTVGQYLQPSREHWPVARYYEPAYFEALKQRALALGFRWAESGPLVRSSYNADAQAAALL